MSSLNLMLEEEDIHKAASLCDVVFLALPAGLAKNLITEEILKQTVIIDLGADFRLKNPKVYEHWYHKEAPNPEILAQAVYSLADIDTTTCTTTNLIANPGCYTTCSILTLAPLVKNGLIDQSSIIINAMSGVSGAGRKESTANLFCEVNAGAKAYGVTTHRHTPEIEAALSAIGQTTVTLQFTPHLVPMNRGILATCTAHLKPEVTQEDVDKAYTLLYQDAPFVNVLSPGLLPETRFTLGTNRIDISYRIDERTRNIVAIGAIDNLVKGAAGQAVQNMNLRFSLDPMEGLDTNSSNPY
jgi:N-acetyl-gamma-glutamyl-phosphate reductase